MRGYARYIAFVGVITVSLVLLLTVVTGMILFARGNRLMSIQSGSMNPVMDSGDAVIVQKPTNIKVGDIITYRLPDNLNVTRTHRVIYKDLTSGWLTTKGDALLSPDAPIPQSQVIGKVLAVAPDLGTIIDLLKHPVAIVMYIYMPVAVLVTGEIMKLLRATRSPYCYAGYARK